MGKLQREIRKQRQRELLTLFEGNYYQEKQVDDNVYIKHFNGNTKQWQVAVYTLASFKRYKQFTGGGKKLLAQAHKVADQLDRELQLAIDKDN